MRKRQHNMTETKRERRVVPLVPTHGRPMLESVQSLEAMCRYAASKGYQIYRPSYRTGSAVHINRNMLLADLLKSRVPFTDTFWWDDDMNGPEDTLVRLIEHDLDIVGALCTNRQRPTIPCARMWDEEVQRWEELWQWPEGLLDMNGGGVGTAVLLTSLNALQKMAEVYFQCMHEKDVWGMSDERAAAVSAERLKSFDIYPNAMWFRWLAPSTGSGENGEDMSFCWAAQRYVDLKVYVDTTIQPGHYGIKSYGIPDFIEHREDAMERARAEGRLKYRHKTHLSPIDQAPPTPDHADLVELIEAAS